MLAPVGDHQEASCAVWAVMRVLARVDADLVALHVAQVAEAQWTVRALVWLLPRMAPQMHRQCRVVHKTLPTLWAHVRLVTDMGAKVYLPVPRKSSTALQITFSWILYIVIKLILGYEGESAS